MTQQKLIERLKKVEENTRSYLNKDFLKEDRMQPLDDKYILIYEIRYLSTFLTGKKIDQEQEIYIKNLIDKIENKDELDFTVINRPSSLRYIYKLALAEVVLEYSKGLNKYCRSEGINFPEDLEKIREKAKRTIATEGKKGTMEGKIKELKRIYSCLFSE